MWNVELIPRNVDGLTLEDELFHVALHKQDFEDGEATECRHKNEDPKFQEHIQLYKSKILNLRWL